MKTSRHALARALRFFAGLRALTYCVASSLILCAFGLAFSAGAQEDERTFASFDPPGSRETFVTDINSHGVVTGSFFDQQYVLRGFLRQTDGKIIVFNAPGAGPGGPPSAAGTQPAAINAEGVITGTAAFGHGFLRTPDGKFTTFDPPNSGYTVPQDINARGVIVGDGQGPFGWVRTSDGTFIEFVAPDSMETQPCAINSKGTVAGWYVDVTEEMGHGFVRSPDGTLITFDPPGSVGTTTESINAEGAVVGSYGDTGDHGFLRDKDGKIIVFDYPGSSGGTYPLKINAEGTVVGQYFEYGFHGFLRYRDGTFVTIDPPNAEDSYPRSINDEGIVAGVYYDTNHAEYGFVMHTSKRANH